MHVHDGIRTFNLFGTILPFSFLALGQKPLVGDHKTKLKLKDKVSLDLYFQPQVCSIV